MYARADIAFQALHVATPILAKRTTTVLIQEKQFQQINAQYLLHKIPVQQGGPL
jgi:hypothetical protein